MTIAEQLPETYSKYLGLTLLSLGRGLAKREKALDRQKKMDLAVQEKRRLLADTFADLDTDRLKFNQGVVRELAGHEWDPLAARTLIVDSLFANPFAPYSLRYDEDDRNELLAPIAFALGRTDPEGEVARAVQFARSAARVHRHPLKRKRVLAAVVVGGGILTGGLGWIAAPMIAGMVGATAGLGGAAATAHGLAILGGGSLAAGGAGMAGGMAVVTAAGAGVGAVTGGGVSLLLALTPEAAQAELVKLQTTFAYTLVPAGATFAQQVLDETRRNATALEESLEATRLRNDKDSPEVEGLERRLKAVNAAHAWMQDASKRG